MSACSQPLKPGYRDPTITNLPSIPLQSLDFFVLGDVAFGVPGVCDLGSASLVVVSEFLEQVAPDLSASVIAELVITQRQVNARHEGFIKLSNSVGREEQYTLEIIKRPQEYCQASAANS